MKVETKYSIGDIVYVRPGYKITKCRIAMIRINISQDDKITISYNLKGVDSSIEFWLRQNEVFATEDELIKTLV